MGAVGAAVLSERGVSFVEGAVAIGAIVKFTVVRDERGAYGCWGVRLKDASGLLFTLKREGVQKASEMANHRNIRLKPKARRCPGMTELEADLLRNISIPPPIRWAMA